MATIAKLVADDVLVPISVEIDDGLLPWRKIFAYPKEGQANFILPWFSTVLPGLASTVGAQNTPEEQVYGLLELFVTGEPLILGTMYKPLHPHPNGVWELKTIDTRVFGWFPCKDHFVAVFVNDATIVHRHGLHHGYVNEVARLRGLLDLDEPKFIPGGDPDAVLSVRP